MKCFDGQAFKDGINSIVRDDKFTSVYTSNV